MSITNMTFGKTTGNLVDVYVTPSPYLQPGDVEIKLTNVKFARVTEEYGYRADELILTGITAEAKSTLPVKVSATNKYGTCILPFDYTLPADGSLEAYGCSEYTDDALLLEEVTELAAYTPYILYSETGFSATLTGDVDASKYPAGGIAKSGYLMGTLVQTELTEASCYVMQNQGSGPMFYQVDPTSPFLLTAGKCYVELPTGIKAKALRIGGSTTSIAPIQNSEFKIQNCIYNLLGQRVDHMLPGKIYIVNGKKVVNK